MNRATVEAQIEAHTNRQLDRYLDSLDAADRREELIDEKIDYYCEGRAKKDIDDDEWEAIVELAERAVDRKLEETEARRNCSCRYRGGCVC